MINKTILIGGYVVIAILVIIVIVILVLNNNYNEAQSTFYKKFKDTNNVALPAFDGEFGAEIDRAIPHAHALYRQWRLRSVACMEGMRSFYEGIFDSAVVIVQPNRRRRDGNGPAWKHILGNNNHAPIRILWEPPVYVGRFRRPLRYPDGVDLSKPLFIIHNKYTTEWDGPPVNFIPEVVVHDLCNRLDPHFTIVVVHPSSSAPGYTPDNQGGQLSNPNLTSAFAYDGLLTIQVLLALNSAMDYNTIQLALHDGCKHFVSVQGGSSRMASLFGGTNVVLHISGSEIASKEYDTVLARLSDVKLHVVRSVPELLGVAARLRP